MKVFLKFKLQIVHTHLQLAVSQLSGLCDRVCCHTGALHVRSRNFLVVCDWFVSVCISGLYSGLIFFTYNVFAWNLTFLHRITE